MCSELPFVDIHIYIYNREASGCRVFHQVDYCGRFFHVSETPSLFLFHSLSQNSRNIFDKEKIQRTIYNLALSSI